MKDGEAYFGTTSQAKYAMRGAETYNITQRVFTKWVRHLLVHPYIDRLLLIW